MTQTTTGARARQQIVDDYRRLFRQALEELEKLRRYECIHPHINNSAGIKECRSEMRILRQALRDMGETTHGKPLA